MRKNEGITLIALVITIIILLILAGISIATLTGENGLLTKANTAKTETKKANAEEQVKIAVTGSFDNEGKLTADKVKEELRKIPNVGEIRDTNGGFPIEVDLDGYTFIIDENGEVTRKAVKPVVDYTLSTKEQVNEGTEVTVTITASIGEEEKITKITKPDGTSASNTNTTSFIVTTNGVYTVTAEGSNGETTTKKITITNIGTAEIFSDIYASTQTYIDSTGKISKIPEGFAVGISSTIDKVDNGLVITDSIDEFHRSTGNEFVWIPVNSKSDFVRIDGYESGEKQTLVSGKTCTEPYSNGSQEEKNLYTAMYNSVTNENNKGFYMGRYEAGNEENKVVVKRNKTVYNYIKWGISDTNLAGGAVELARNFTNNKLYKEKVTSTLVYGVQWDRTLQFFNNQSYIKDSTGKGNYTVNKPIPTGSNEKYKMKNIYDMAGNVAEWTMEAWHNYGNYRVYRGGKYGFNGYIDAASTRVIQRCDSDNNNMVGGIGFRIALYFR